MRRIKRRASYLSVIKYFYICRRLGLIEFVRQEVGRGKYPRRIYRVRAGMENDPRWSAPQAALYPETRWGGARYGKAVERGLVPRRVRPPRRAPGILPGMEEGVPRPKGLPPPFPHGTRRPKRTSKGKGEIQRKLQLG